MSARQTVELTGPGSPLGVQNAWFAGQTYRDETTGTRWISTGQDKQDWIPATPVSVLTVFLGPALGELQNPIVPHSPAGYEFVADPATVGLVVVVFDAGLEIWKATCSENPLLEWFLLIPGLTADDTPLGTFTSEAEDSYFTIAFA